MEGKKKKDRERKKERKSRTHRGRTLARGSDTCCSAFLPFLQETQRGGKKKMGRRERTKTQFPFIPMGVLKPAVPHIAAPI